MAFRSATIAAATRAPGCPGCSSRRGFLSGLLAAGSGSALGALAACATAPGITADAGRVDVHHHFFSPTYKRAIEKQGRTNPLSANWTVAKTLDDMDRAGVSTAVLSLTNPQVAFATGEAGRALARESNEWAAELGRTHPGRFGSFAVLPLTDIDGSLAEIAYALDVLKADGFAVMTNYGDKWLGHPSFAPVMDELNRRGSVLLAHPQAANCCANLMPRIPTSVIEYGTDTTRTIVDIVFSGTAARCPKLDFIFSHAGGTMPFLTERLTKLPEMDKSLLPMVPNGVLHELRRFYYDTAWAANPMALSSLLSLVDVQQVLLGSDFPYRTGEDDVRGLLAYGFKPKELQLVTGGNARRLLAGLPDDGRGRRPAG